MQALPYASLSRCDRDLVMAKSKKLRIEETGGISIAEALGMKSEHSDQAHPPASGGEGAKTHCAKRTTAHPPAAGGEGREQDAGAVLSAASQAALRIERSGRGGRSVTTIALRPAPTRSAAEQIAKMMRKELGCGSRVEGDAQLKIVLQGEIRERAAAWLTARGVKRIV